MKDADADIYICEKIKNKKKDNINDLHWYAPDQALV